jgi:hypothetical protein
MGLHSSCPKIVLWVRANETELHDPRFISNHHDQPVIVPADIGNNAITREKFRGRTAADIFDQIPARAATSLYQMSNGGVIYVWEAGISTTI